MDWQEWMSSCDFFAPRGLESYVPALAHIRQELWPHLDESVQLALHVADYLGLPDAVELRGVDLERLELILPGPVWDRCAALGHPGLGELLSLGRYSGIMSSIGNALARVNQVK